MIVFLLSDIAKALGHKYHRKYKKNGRWVYVYAEGDRHGSHSIAGHHLEAKDHHLHEGASFSAGSGKGHLQVHSVKDGKVTFHHDDIDGKGTKGEHKTVSVEEFKKHVEGVHGDAAKKHAKEGHAKRENILEKAREYGTPKQIARAEKELARWKELNKKHLKAEAPDSPEPNANKETPPAPPTPPPALPTSLKAQKEKAEPKKVDKNASAPQKALTMSEQELANTEGVKKLGEGVFGRVYLHNGPPPSAIKHGAVFKAEINAANAAGELGVGPKVYGSEGGGPKAKLSMEFLENHKTVAQMDEPSKERAQGVATIFKHIAKLHGAGISHGDLHLNNMMIGADGSAKLIDFGLSNKGTRAQFGDLNRAPTFHALVDRMKGSISSEGETKLRTAIDKIKNTKSGSGLELRGEVQQEVQEEMGKLARAGDVEGLKKLAGNLEAEIDRRVEEAEKQKQAPLKKLVSEFHSTVADVLQKEGL